MFARPTRAIPFVVLLGCLAASSGCDPFHTGFDSNEPAARYRAREPTPAPKDPDQLTVMTWNVKFGGARIDFFFDCFGDRALMSRDEVLDNLEGLARKIRQVDPDLVFLQEVDVNSKRSAFVDQLQWLLDHTELNHAVYASQWHADFVPSDGLGAMDNGNAILSRWPLSDARRIALPLRKDQDALTRYFYLRHGLLLARTEIGGREIALIDVHSAAYAKDGTKLAHIARFEQTMDELADEAAIVIGGGDLNTLPPDSDKLMGFDDSACEDEDFVDDDYRDDVGVLDGLYEHYEPAIPLEDYRQDNARYFSHTVDGRGLWNRKLDYIFTSGHWQPGSGLVHQDEAHGGMETMPLSDHAPVSAVLELP